MSYHIMLHHEIALVNSDVCFKRMFGLYIQFIVKYNSSYALTKQLFDCDRHVIIHFLPTDDSLLLLNNIISSELNEIVSFLHSKLAAKCRQM